ncbi:MAG: (Fe-S)-binding protein [Acidobacteria bacterium]|nr:(Fe-S)-binding protein [Acidobacteriota bacterium]
MNPVPGAWYYIFLVVVVAAVVLFYFRIHKKWRLLITAAPAARFDQPGRRLKNVLVHVFGQKRILQDAGTGLMHALIFWGFCILFIHTASVFIVGLTGWDLEQRLGHWYGCPKDAFVAFVLLAVVYAFFRRGVLRPFRVDDSGEAYLVLGLIFILMVTDVAMEGALGAHPETAAHGFLGVYLKEMVAGWFSPAGLETLFSVSWWIQAVTILAFLNILPGSKHFHVITSLPNVYFQELNPPGKLKTLDLEDEETETFGTSRAEHLDWKLLLDVYTCTECGRCHEFCPTHTTDKPLSPKRMNDHIKEFVYRNQDKIIAGQTAELPDLFEAGVVGHDEIWACTTCRFCETACPLFIEEVPWIVDFRRHETLMESNFPKELTKAFKGLENNSNPWGIGAHQRAEWAADLDVPLAGEVESFEYLFFVGCSGSFDDRNKQVARALVRLLRKAGVSFAILGEAEGCCGDMARRTGNELLFQELATTNIETFNEAGVRKIITACPHGYNTIRHEYPEFGGTYEVYHHTEFLEKLLLEGKLKPIRQLDGKIAYHDSCYLGRYNDIYAAPRNVLRHLANDGPAELELHHERGYCCGGGGGRIFMEETIGTRINHTRIDHVRTSGCRTVASACPFCMTMLADGVAEKNVEQVEVRDIAQLLWEAMDDGSA